MRAKFQKTLVKRKKKVGERRRPKPLSRKPADVLLRAMARYVTSIGGSCFVAGPIGHMNHPNPRPLGDMKKFYVVIECFGQPPKKEEEKTNADKSPNAGEENAETQSVLPGKD